MRNIAIIGTAGRYGCMRGRTDKDFLIMLEHAYTLVEDPLGDVHLYSGGAAWADQLAVELYMQGIVKHLTLFLPAPITYQNRFWEGGNINKPGDGRTANYYHMLFTQAAYNQTDGLNQSLFSVQRISDAGIKGANLQVNKNGFWARNSQVAEHADDTLIAYTWGKTGRPTDGSTLDTWHKNHAHNKIHVNLFDLLPALSKQEQIFNFSQKI